MLCIAKIASQGYLSNRPSSSMRTAPLWQVPNSSAGWKIRFSVPDQSSDAASAFAAHISIAV